MNDKAVYRTTPATPGMLIKMDNFIVEVLYSRDDFPEVFTVARAVSHLESLPWPKDYLVISSQPPNYHL